MAVRIPINPNYHLNLHFDQSISTQHEALDKYIKGHGYRKTILRLNALRTLLKNRNPSAARAASEDMHYVQARYALYKEKHKKQKPKKAKKAVKPKKSK